MSDAQAPAKWADMDGKRRWRYVFRVVVTICTMGYVFPNSVVE